MDIRIERGTPAHLDACAQALRESVLGEKYFAREGSAREAVLEGLNDGTLYVGLSGGDCVGFFYYLPRGACHAFPYLHLIAVAPGHRGEGIGSVLLDGFEKLAFAASDKAFLVVADFNPDGKRFYEKHGYRQVGTLPDLYRPGITEYLMLKVKA